MFQYSDSVLCVSRLEHGYTQLEENVKKLKEETVHYLNSVSRHRSVKNRMDCCLKLGTTESYLPTCLYIYGNRLAELMMHVRISQNTVLNDFSRWK